jgi:hypothetical protein
LSQPKDEFCEASLQRPEYFHANNFLNLLRFNLKLFKSEIFFKTNPGLFLLINVKTSSFVYSLLFLRSNEHTTDVSVLDKGKYAIGPI